MPYAALASIPTFYLRSVYVPPTFHSCYMPPRHHRITKHTFKTKSNILHQPQHPDKLKNYMEIAFLISKSEYRAVWSKMSEM